MFICINSSLRFVNLLYNSNHWSLLKLKYSHFNFIEIAIRRECSPVNLLHIFRAPFEGCFLNDPLRMIYFAHNMQANRSSKSAKEYWAEYVLYVATETRKLCQFRSSCPKVFCVKGFLRNFAKFTPVSKSLLNKTADCRYCATASVLLLLLLTLNPSTLLIWYFFCWLWANILRCITRVNNSMKFLFVHLFIWNDINYSQKFIIFQKLLLLLQDISHQ